MKTYKITWTRKNRPKALEGTLTEIESYFSYTLAIGNSYNPKIKTSGYRTINSLIRNINKAIDLKCGGWDKPYISLDKAGE